MNNLCKSKGIVIEIIAQSSFKVKLEDETIIDATISEKMKVNLDFEIYVDEEVPIDMSPYERTRGRINFRHWVRTAPEK